MTEYPKIFKCDCGGLIEIISLEEAERVVKDQCPFCGKAGSYHVKI